MSGRGLRKLPVKAHAFFLQRAVVRQMDTPPCFCFLLTKLNQFYLHCFPLSEIFQLFSFVHFFFLFLGYFTRVSNSFTADLGSWKSYWNLIWENKENNRKVRIKMKIEIKMKMKMQMKNLQGNWGIGFLHLITRSDVKIF